MKRLPRILSILLLVVALAAVAVVPVSADYVPTTVSVWAKTGVDTMEPGVSMSITMTSYPYYTVWSGVTDSNGQCTASFYRYEGDSFVLTAYKAGLGTLVSGAYDFGGSAPYYGWAYYHQNYASLSNRPPRN